MRTHDPTILSGQMRSAQGFIAGMKCLRVFLPRLLSVFLLGVASCSKDPGMAAIETDANGYLCLKCGAKMYTDRTVFLENCPKCKQDGLAEVVGYMCLKDHHLTLRPKVSGPEGAAVCEQCNAHLKSALVSPHLADLKKWGAIKTTQ
jgi:hypothetical protein